MAGRHHRCNEHELGQILGGGKGQTGRPGMLQSMGSQRVGHDWVTEQQQGENKGPFKLHLKQTQMASSFSFST